MTNTQKFRSIPVLVEGKQFLDDATAVEIAQWLGTPPIKLIAGDDGNIGKIYVEGEDGGQFAFPGDWVLQRADGSGFEIGKLEIFENTYETAVTYDEADVEAHLAGASEPVSAGTVNEGTFETVPQEFGIQVTQSPDVEPAQVSEGLLRRDRNLLDG